MKVCLKLLNLLTLILLITLTALIPSSHLQLITSTQDEHRDQDQHKQKLKTLNGMDPLPNKTKDAGTDRLPVEDTTVTVEGTTVTEVPSIPSIEGWELIWHDEFEDHALNRSKWTTENWAAEKNNELQFYTPQNIMLENGLLKIVSEKESFEGREYTSGALHTKNKFSFLYGKVELRAKLPSGQGMFPAFWMMPNQEQTWLPEIDILEMLGHQPDEIWMVVHWLDNDNRLKSSSSSYKGPDYSADYHTFGIEWSPDQITWFIDGIERYQTDDYIPDQEMYLYVNTAIGGNWPGSPDQTTTFPQYFEIDYIRVYQKIGGVGAE